MRLINTLGKSLLFINLFFLQSYLLKFVIGAYPTNLQEILIAAQALVFLYTIIKTRTFLNAIQSLKNHWIILSFAILTGISILLVPIENTLDFARHLKFLFFALVLTFIFLETFKNAEERKKGMTVAGLGAIFFGLFSIIYNLLGYNVAPDSRLLGPLDAAVYLGFYLTPFFIFFVIELFENPYKKINLLYALTLGILILMTQSMGSLGGSLIIILLYLFKRSESKILKKKLTKIILGLVCVAFAVVIFYSKILPTIKTEYSSMDERGEIWATSIQLIKEPKTLLLGAGFGQFQEQYFRNVDKALGKKPLDYYVLQPHNIFLLFIFQYGILGLIFILFCIYKNIKELIATKTSSLLISANFILLYFFIHGLIDTPFFKNDMLILFILFLELSLTKSTLQPSHQSTKN